MTSNKQSTIRIAKKQRQMTEAKQRAKVNAEKKNIKYGQRLTGKTEVPNLMAMKKKKIISSMD